MRLQRFRVGAVVVVVVGLLASVSFWVEATPANSSVGAREAPSVRGTHVTAQDLVQRVAVSGTLEPAGFQEVRAEFSAGSVRFLVEAGDRVKAGQALVELDTSQQKQVVAGLEASLAKARAHLEELKWEQQMEPARQDQKVAQAQLALAQAQQDLQAAIASVSVQVGKARLAVLAVERRQAELAAKQAEANGQVVQAETALLFNPDDAAARQALDQARLAQEIMVAESAATARQLDEELAQAQEALRVAEQNARPENLDSAPQVQLARLAVASAQQALAAVQSESLQSIVLAEQIRAAAADVTLATQSLAAARAKLQLATLKAPVDGVVVSVGLKDGQAVEENGVILGLSDTSQLTLKAQVTEKDVTKIEPGQAFTIETDNFPGVVFSGKIVRVPVLTKEENDAGSGTFFPVEGLLRNPDGQLRPGMRVSASVVIAERNDALVIPTSAIREVHGQTYVVVVEDFRAHVRAVKMGLRTDEQAEVLNGIAAGDLVVIAPTRLVQTLKDGDRLRLDSAPLESGQSK